MSGSQRSGIEQMLIARSLERSIAQLDLARFSGKTVWLEVYSLTGDTQFANKLIGTEMQEKGLNSQPTVTRRILRSRFFSRPSASIPAKH
jgi:hypothetical protein